MFPFDDGIMKKAHARDLLAERDVSSFSMCVDSIACISCDFIYISIPEEICTLLRHCNHESILTLWIVIM